MKNILETNKSATRLASRMRARSHLCAAVNTSLPSTGDIQLTLVQTVALNGSLIVTTST